MIKNFNWDSWATKTTFFGVWGKTAYLQNIRAIPTCFSPDGRYLYLSSLDYAVDVVVVSELEQALEDILQSYLSRLYMGDSSNTKLNLAIRQCDFDVVCQLLDKLKEQDVDQLFKNKEYNYSLPNDLFKELLEKLKK